MLTQIADKNSPGSKFPRRRSILAPVSALALGLLTLAAPALAAAPAPFHVEEATIAQIQSAILAKQLTATQLVKIYLTRIKAYNGPGVEEPNGILGKVNVIPHAKGINALSTLNLRPETRKAWGFDDRHARSGRARRRVRQNRQTGGSPSWRRHRNQRSI